MNYKCFGIVDGIISNEDIKKLVCTKKTWCNVQWQVLLLQRHVSVARLKQLGRTQNSKYGPK